MNPGELNQKITIQQNLSTAVNSLNENVPTWTTYASPYAAVKETGSRELFYAQKVYAETEAVFIIRYKSGIDSKMRIVWGTRTFEIIGTPIDPDKKRSMLHIPAKEVTA